MNICQWESCVQSGSSISLPSLIDSQLSGLQQVKAIQSDQTQTSAGKVLASVLRNAQGILFIDYLEKTRTINSEYYIALLACFKERSPKTATNEEKKVLFHQDNVPCHKSIAMMAKLHELHLKLLLVPSDYWLFADLKTMLQGKRFGFNEEVILETEAYFEVKDKPLNKKASNG